MATFATSGFFPTTVVGALRAPAQIVQWNPAGPSPSGYRNIESGVYKPTSKYGGLTNPEEGFRGGFTAQKESGVPLDFGTIFIPSELNAAGGGSGFDSETIVFTFNLGETVSHPQSHFDQMVASGTTSRNFKAFNLRMWQGNLDAFHTAIYPSGTQGRPTFYWLPSSEWRQNYKLVPTIVSGVTTVLNSGVRVLQDSMPSDYNVDSISNTPYISGAYKRREFSKFIYMKARWNDLPSGVDYQLGTHGDLGEGSFTLKFSYDYTSIDANTRYPEDFFDTALSPTDRTYPISTVGIGVSGHYQFNEPQSDSTYISRASGFPGESMTLQNVLEAGGSVKQIAGIVASGSASGYALDFDQTRRATIYRSDNQAPTTMRFDGNQGDGNVSFTFCGWVALNDPSGLDPNVGAGVRPPTADTGILCSYNFRFALQQTLYRCWYSASTKRFWWNVYSFDQYHTYLVYHDLNVDNQDNGYDGGVQPNKWHWLCFGLDAEGSDESRQAGSDHGGGELFFRVDDGPIQRMNMAADEPRTNTYNTFPGSPFAMAGYTRSAGNGSIMNPAGAYDSWTLYRGKALNNAEMDQIYNQGVGIDYPFPTHRIIDYSLPPEQAIYESNPTPHPLRIGLRVWYSFNEATSGTLQSADDQRYSNLVFQNPVGVAEIPAAASGFHYTDGPLGAQMGSTSGALECRTLTAHSDGAPASSGWWQSTSNFQARMRGRHNYTIACWWRPQTLGVTHAICGLWQDAGNLRHWRIRMTSDNHIRFLQANGTTIGMPSELTTDAGFPSAVVAGRWYLILVERDQGNQLVRLTVYDAETGQSYVSQQSSVTFQLTTITPTTPFTIGAYNTNGGPVYCNGDIGSFGTWHRLLSANEKVQLFNNGNSREFSQF